MKDGTSTFKIVSSQDVVVSSLDSSDGVSIVKHASDGTFSLKASSNLNYENLLTAQPTGGEITWSVEAFDGTARAEGDSYLIHVLDHHVWKLK